MCGDKALTVHALHPHRVPQNKSRMHLHRGFLASQCSQCRGLAITSSSHSTTKASTLYHKASSRFTSQESAQADSNKKLKKKKLLGLSLLLLLPSLLSLP